MKIAVEFHQGSRVYREGGFSNWD